MKKGRLEAFSDGVIAIIITIMVLELKVPHGADWANLQELAPVFICYVLSFINVGIYWNNHHHLFQSVDSVTGKTLLVNLILLFWLSLMPFTTGWMGENHFASLPVLLYGLNCLMCAFAYFLLSKSLLSHHGKDSAIAEALGTTRKEYISLLFLVIGVLTAMSAPFVAFGFYVAVVVIWAIPDRRIEKRLAK